MHRKYIYRLRNVRTGYVLYRALVFPVLIFQDGYGRSPLHCCAKSGTVETLQMLVSLNCDLSSVDSEGRTAVYSAVGMTFKLPCS